MAGHSKWANIQYRKNAQDARRGKLFTKLIREITVSARVGGGDPNHNPRLRAAVDKALTANMTRDTVDRAIKRGVGGLEDANMEEIRYEGYGPGGVAVLVECLTDNRTRTVGEVRHAFTKFGGNLGTDGSVAYLFGKKGVITFAPGQDEEKILETALEGGAEDVAIYDDKSIDVIAMPEDFLNVKNKLIEKNFIPVQAEVTYVPATTVKLEGEELERMEKMINMLEDLDDVQNVYSNVST